MLSEEKIIYTSNQIFKNDLKSIYNSNHYYIDSNQNIYKLDTKKEFIFDLLNIKKEDKENYYDAFQVNTKNCYIIHYLENDSSEKIILVSKISNIKNSEKYLKISLAIFTLFFMIYWIIVTFMIYQNALKLKINAYLWGMITLLTNMVGVVFYLIYVGGKTTCKKCHTSISSKDRYCKNCGEKI